MSEKKKKPSKSLRMNWFVWIGLKDEFYCNEVLYSRGIASKSDLVESGMDLKNLALYREQDVYELSRFVLGNELLDGGMFECLAACTADDAADALLVFSGVRVRKAMMVNDTVESRNVGLKDVIYDASTGKVLVLTNGGFYEVDDSESKVVREMSLSYIRQVVR